MEKKEVCGCERPIKKNAKMKDLTIDQQAYLIYGHKKTCPNYKERS